MPTNSSVFRERLAEACRIRGTTSDAVCRSIGMGGRRALNVHLLGLHALDLYRVCQIADRLEVSVDWLLGRSDVMYIAQKKRGLLRNAVCIHGSAAFVLAAPRRYIEITICYAELSGL